MNEKTLKILESLFREYYSKNSDKIFEPPKIENREFAFQTFKGQGMLRHIAFENSKEMREYIKNLVPQHAYYSTAFYVLPSAQDMDEKDWLGAELVFDIDSDHLKTSCKEIHDYWTCMTCGFKGKGSAVEVCPNCSSKTIKEFTWVCDKCIEAAKNEVIKLIEEFLVPDIGFSPRDMMLVFSGHRGFHLHVLCDECFKLTSEERREIVDYLKAVGINWNILLPKRYGEIIGFDLKEAGWRGKIARRLFDLFLNIDENYGFLNSILDDKIISNLNKSADKIVKEIMEKPPKWTTLYRVLSKRNLIGLLNRIVEKQRCDIDEKVTIDTHRLIRLPGTLHGKTGLPVLILDIGKIEEFEVTGEFSPFKGEAKITFLEDISGNLKVLGETIIGRRGSRKKVSLPIAIYLASRELAEIEAIVK